MPVIFVIGGINGAGKSSVTGQYLRDRGKNYFNPDEATKRILADRGRSLEEANSLAWKEGKDRLEAAIQNGKDFAFESTLGATTIPRLLREASEAGLEVIVWFVGLDSPEKHLERIRGRVAAGGHDIPEEKVRERWAGSRRNLIGLLPYLAELRVFDNSADRDPVTGVNPPPRELLHWKKGRILVPPPELIEATPEWAKPIVARALQLARTGT